jgi:hypothetical protein
MKQKQISRVELASYLLSPSLFVMVPDGGEAMLAAPRRHGSSSMPGARSRSANSCSAI